MSGAASPPQPAIGSGNAAMFIDLDGTILDARRRLHSLFCKLAPDVLPNAESYWQHKRAPRSHDWILSNLAGWSDSRIDQFKADWLGLIEQPEYLALDSLEPGTLEALQALSRRGPLYLLTARQSRENLHGQLVRLGLDPYFTAVLATGGARSKAETVRSQGIATKPGDLLIGDTAEDLEAARSLGVGFIAVCNGFRCEDYLRKRGATRIYASLVDFALEQ